MGSIWGWGLEKGFPPPANPRTLKECRCRVHHGNRIQGRALSSKPKHEGSGLQMPLHEEGYRFPACLLAHANKMIRFWLWDMPAINCVIHGNLLNFKFWFSPYVVEIDINTSLLRFWRAWMRYRQFFKLNIRISSCVKQNYPGGILYSPCFIWLLNSSQYDTQDLGNSANLEVEGQKPRVKKLGELRFFRDNWYNAKCSRKVKVTWGSRYLRMRIKCP